MTVNRSDEEGLPCALEGPASLPTLIYISKGYANEKLLKCSGLRYKMTFSFERFLAISITSQVWTRFPRYRRMIWDPIMPYLLYTHLQFLPIVLSRIFSQKLRGGPWVSTRWGFLHNEISNSSPEILAHWIVRWNTTMLSSFASLQFHDISSLRRP